MVLFIAILKINAISYSMLFLIPCKKSWRCLLGENAPQAVNNIEEYREQCQRISERFRLFAQENPSNSKIIIT